jgi:hypothetical protein
MNKFKLALAGLAAVGAAVVAAPEPAKAQVGISVGFGGPAYYGGGWGYGYRPIRYGYGPGWGYGYRRPIVRRVVYGYPAYYRRPVVRRVVYRPAYYARPYRVAHRYGYGYGRPVGYYHRGWW